MPAYEFLGPIMALALLGGCAWMLYGEPHQPHEQAVHAQAMRPQAFPQALASQSLASQALASQALASQSLASQYGKPLPAMARAE